MSDWQAFVRENIHSTPGAGFGEKMKKLAAKYKKGGKGKTKGKGVAKKSHTIHRKKGATAKGKGKGRGRGLIPGGTSTVVPVAKLSGGGLVYRSVRGLTSANHLPSRTGTIAEILIRKNRERIARDIHRREQREHMGQGGGSLGLAITTAAALAPVIATAFL